MGRKEEIRQRKYIQHLTLQALQPPKRGIKRAVGKQKHLVYVPNSQQKPASFSAVSNTGHHDLKYSHAHLFAELCQASIGFLCLCRNASSTLVSVFLAPVPGGFICSAVTDKPASRR